MRSNWRKLSNQTPDFANLKTQISNDRGQLVAAAPNHDYYLYEDSTWNNFKKDHPNMKGVVFYEELNYWG